MSSVKIEKGYHVHQCPDCGYAWQHPNGCRNHHPSHICPRCDSEDYENGVRVKNVEPEICFLGRHYPANMPKPTAEEEEAMYGKPSVEDQSNEERLIRLLAKILGI